MDDITKAAERVRQVREALQADPFSVGAPAPTVRAGQGWIFRLGERVFDTVTGQEGEVIARTRENVILPASR
jgi:hypothetical protein